MGGHVSDEISQLDALWKLCIRSVGAARIIRLGLRWRLDLNFAGPEIGVGPCLAGSYTFSKLPFFLSSGVSRSRGIGIALL